ncbi:uncharacterized protein EAE98_008143 [Botrytis deweyae]|uniref:Uncharacterized protein n=1 Tax=Botrytis deweyae TaxID=2478750 RepID=A0ABQ7IFU1_9HELO|nr:uncharacterized protein EAE98_008143 [Botrytis deweyae]KAF7922617.1 hypothetical protein EAE98_008143 [Botrytis deweyae]
MECIMRFPTAILFSGICIFAYYTMADPQSLADTQKFFQLSRQLVNEFVKFASLFMTHLLEIAGPLILHFPKENERPTTNTSVTHFLVHWAFVLMFMLEACVLMLYPDVKEVDVHRLSCFIQGVWIHVWIGFYALYWRSCSKNREITAPNLDRAALVASNSNQK